MGWVVKVEGQREQEAQRPEVEVSSLTWAGQLGAVSAQESWDKGVCKHKPWNNGF